MPDSRVNTNLTVPDLLHTTCNRVPRQAALGTIQVGRLTWLTWQELADQVARVAAGLAALGVEARDRVGQWAPNSRGWILTDLAILELGAVHVPLHASLSVGQIDRLLKLADVKLLVTANPDSGARFPSWAVVSHAELLATAAGPDCQPHRPDPDDLATILFTSGTSSQPRGVMLSHCNLTSNSAAVREAVGGQADELRLCFLPLSHIYARTCDLYTWLLRGSRLVLAESRDTILRDCQLVHPTVINGVPYFYQKVADGLCEADKQDTSDSLRQLLGGKIRRCFCGGAAVPPEIERVFERRELPVLSGYGLTEASPVVTATHRDNYAAGTVGRPLPGVEVRIAEDGEIHVRGENVMLGYWRDEAATAEVLRNGWFATGDLGEFDEQGNLRIVGRAKELLVLSTGKKISPSLIESYIQGSHFIEQACVVGEGQKCLGALIVPNPETLRRFVREHRLWVWSKRRATTHPRVRAAIRGELDRLLTGLSRPEQIGPFTLLERGFSAELGELTPKQSLRRAVIAHSFQAEIAALYRIADRQDHKLEN